MKSLLIALTLLILSSCVQVEVTDTSIKPEESAVSGSEQGGRKSSRLLSAWTWRCRR